MKNHYLYQIICLIPNENGVLKIYSGVRSCKKLPQDDEYFGSGHYLKSAIKKHGKENFVKTIIATFPTREEAYAAETAWLEKKFDFAGRDWKTFNSMFYNLRMNEAFHNGGFACSTETRKKISESKTGIAIWLAGNHPMKGRHGELNPFFNKKHTEEAKKKISEIHSGKTISEEHRQAISEKVSGENHPLFDGYSIGFNEKQVVVIEGFKEIKSRGFNAGCISECINGKRKSHKNMKWIRTKNKSEIEKLRLERVFYDKESEDHFNSME